MQTFTCSPEETKFSLNTKHIEAAQNVKCLNCKDVWKNHFAGVSTTIPQGACLIDLNVVYS